MSAMQEALELLIPAADTETLVRVLRRLQERATTSHVRGMIEAELDRRRQGHAQR